MHNFYQPLIENALFYRLFCLIVLISIVAVMAYLVFLSQIPVLWLIVVGISLVAMVYWGYLCQLSDQRVLANSEKWIVLSNEKFQNSSYGIEGDAIVILIFIFPFVLLTWFVYSLFKIMAFKNY